MMLTKQQVQCLVAIRRLTRGGVSPSTEELREELGLASKSNVQRLLNGLEERGYIRRLRYRARSIEVLRLPACAADPYSVEAITALSREAFAQLEAVVSTVARCRLRDRALAREIGEGTRP